MVRKKIALIGGGQIGGKVKFERFRGRCAVSVYKKEYK